MRYREAFSLIEILIAMTISLVIAGVMMFTYISQSNDVGVGLAILDLTRTGSLLDEQVKQDLRLALRDKGSVEPTGTGVVIHRYSGDKVITVDYTFDAPNHR